MDDLKVADAARLTILRDKWLIARGRPTPETKARIKKRVEAEKKRPRRRTRPGRKPKERARL